MQKAIHNQKTRIEAKRKEIVESATAIIEAIAERRVDAYEGWQRVSGIFQRNAGLGLPELKDFVQIEGVHPNSTLTVSEELRNAIWAKRCPLSFNSVIGDNVWSAAGLQEV